MTTLSSSVENPLWRQKIYFPLESTARLEFMVTPTRLDPTAKLRIKIQNNNESYQRIFHIYNDGYMKAETTTLGTSAIQTIEFSNVYGWFTERKSVLPTLEITWGANNEGWKLHEVSMISGSMTMLSMDAYDDPREVSDHSYPYRTFAKPLYVFLAGYDGVTPGNPALEATFYSNSQYTRYLYLYINDQYVTRKIYKSGNTVVWNEIKNFVSPAKIFKIEFKVYVPCSACWSEVWMLDSWNFKETLSWPVLIKDEPLSLHTDWTPSSSVKIDIRDGFKYFVDTMFMLFKGQVIYTNQWIRWNIIPDSCTIYWQCANRGDFNVFWDDIPDKGDQPFASGSRSYYSSQSPSVNSHSTWVYFNTFDPFAGDHFAFAHEFGHMKFGLADQYYDFACPNFIMGKTYDLNWEVEPDYNMRWDIIPASCFKDGINSTGWDNDMELIRDMDPDIASLYYFDWDWPYNGHVSVYADNIFDFIQVTEIQY